MGEVLGNDAGGGILWWQKLAMPEEPMRTWWCIGDIIGNNTPSPPDLSLKVLVCLFVIFAGNLFIFFWFMILPLYP